MPICAKGACACAKKEYSSSDGTARAEAEPARVQDPLVAKCKKMWSEQIKGESVPIPLTDEMQTILYNICFVANGRLISGRSREEVASGLVQLAEKRGASAVTIGDVISFVLSLYSDAEQDAQAPPPTDAAEEQKKPEEQEADEQVVQAVRQLIRELFPSKIGREKLDKTEYPTRKDHRERVLEQAGQVRGQLNTQAIDSARSGLMGILTTCSIKFQGAKFTYQTRLLRTPEGLEPPKYKYRVGYRPLGIPGGRVLKMFDIDHALIQLDDVVFEIHKGLDGNANYHVCNFKDFEKTRKYKGLEWDDSFGYQETYMSPQVLDDILSTSGEWKNTYNWRDKNCHHFVVACLELLGTKWQFDKRELCCLHSATPVAGEYLVQMPDGTQKSAAELGHSVWQEAPEQPHVITLEVGAE